VAKTFPVIGALGVPGFKAGVNWISLLWTTSVLAGLISFLTQMILARCLSVSDYGALSAAYRLLSVLAPVAGFGVGAYWLRLFGKEGFMAQRWIKPSLGLVLMTSTGCVGFVLGLGLLLDSGGDAERLVLLLSPVVVFWAASELGKARLQLEGRYRALSMLDASFVLGCFLVAWIAWLTSGGVALVAAGYSSAALILGAVHVGMLVPMATGRFDLAGHRPHGTAPIESRVRVRDCLRVAANAWPFALAGILYLTHYQVGVVLVERIQGTEPAGIYNVAVTIMGAVYLLPAAIYGKFLMPKIQRWAEHDRERFIRVYKFGNGVMLLLGGVLMLGVALSSITIIPWFFGDRYTESGRVLLLMALCVPVRFLANNVASILATGKHMKRKNRCDGIGALMSILLNLLLIPGLGIYGAAVSTLLTESALVLMFLYTARKHVLGQEALRGWNIRVSSLEGHEHNPRSP
jgi:O-antigen/teichoic acid export membrane protein